MNRRRQFCAAALCCAVAAAGCQSSGQPRRPLLQRLGVSTASRGDALKDPERVHVAYGRLNEQTGDLDTARNSYQSAIEQNPQSVDAILGLARLDLLAGRVHEAERRFLKAEEVKPGDPDVIESVGQFYLTQDRLEDAVKEFTKGIELAPSNKRLRHKLGIALAREGRIAAAEQQFVQAVGEAEADYNIGLILYEKGETAAAEQRFLDAVLKKPTLAQAQHWLDAVRQELGQPTASGVGPDVQQAGASGRGTSRAVTREAAYAALPEHERATPPLSVELSPSPNSPLPIQGQPAVNSPLPTQPLPTQPLQTSRPPTTPVINPGTMNATQLEQLENSMTPDELARFRAALRNGQTTTR